MFIFQVPYELIEQLFGKTIADNFTPIMVMLCVIGILIKMGKRNKPDKQDDPEIRNGWTYNESARIWVDPEQMNQEKNRKAYEANRKRWQEFEEAEAEREAARRAEQLRQEQLREEIKEAASYITQEEQELAKQIYERERASRQPTYEEWKAAREAEQGSGGA